MNQFLWGACAAVSLTIALLFARFWSHTRDRLFAMFAAAFGTFAVHWTILGLLDPRHESRHAAYVLRLLAFGLIVAAIVDKNRARKRG